MMALKRVIFFGLIGYLSGSILYGPLWARFLHTGSITDNSKDHNPGVANAFTYGGFRCGVLTLVCELLKGYIPVKMYILITDKSAINDPLFAIVLAAPVFGHIFSMFHGFRGGKGIAATFGCLLGLLPLFPPVGIMAFTFVFFSVILKISPHFYRTAAAYLAALPAMAVFSLKTGIISVTLGFAAITIAVVYRLYRSPEEREKVKISLLWMH